MKGFNTLLRLAAGRGCFFIRLCMEKSALAAVWRHKKPCRKKVVAGRKTDWWVKGGKRGWEKGA